MFNDDGTVAGYRKRIAITGRLKILPLSGTENVRFMSVKPGSRKRATLKSSYPENMSKVTISGLLLNTGLQRIQKNIKTKNTAREELERPGILI